MGKNSAFSEAYADKYIKKLKKHKKKTILKSELESIFAVYSDGELFEIIKLLSEAGLLSAVKSSKTNGNRVYPIYFKYKVAVPEENYENELKSISELHPELLKSGYLQSKPQEFKKYRLLLQKLDRYLFANKENPEPVSRKERSFEIFDEEKVLDDKAFCGLLNKLGLDEKSLFFYDTPEYCFNDYIPEKLPELTLLICENKDIWFNIRRLMFENNAKEIFGTHIDGVVYGCGNKISGKGALTLYSRFIGVDVKYLYWGDIDRAGLNIYLSTIENNPQLDITLFTPAYEEMLRLSQNRVIPDSDDQRGVVKDYSSLFTCVSEQLRADFEKSIEENKRIPQEIISYAFLKNNMR
ncbi:MAG: DUF2220 family protein [Acutalibacteraceae bacterium]|nr:DUF2220 family protein [Acutalibacteraceae bacterium]